MPGLGKIQRRIKRAFLANPGARLTTGDLVRWSYPRLDRAGSQQAAICLFAAPLKPSPSKSAELIRAASSG